MPEMKIHNVENKALFMGDNEFEYGLLTVPANTMIPAGALLKRIADTGKFEPVVNTNPADIPVAVNPVEIKNAGAQAGDFSFRALIAGKVRRDLLSIGGQPITDAQGDMLRAYGIIARAVYDTSRLDNQ
jgi:hypothetical protein